MALSTASLVTLSLLGVAIGLSKSNRPVSSRSLNVELTKRLSREYKDTAQTGRINAKELIQTSLRDGHFPPDLCTYTAAMQHSRAKYLHTEALDIYDMMITEGSVQPDRVILGVALSCCTEGPQHDKAIEIFHTADHLFKLGSSRRYVDEDRYIYAAAMVASEEASHYDLVLDYFDKILSTYGMRPSAGILNCVLRCCARLGYWDRFDSIQGMLALNGRKQMSSDCGINTDPPAHINTGKPIRQCIDALIAAESPQDIWDALKGVTVESAGDQPTVMDLVERCEFMCKDEIRVDVKLKRQLLKVVKFVTMGPHRMDTSAVELTIDLIGTLIESAGQRGNATLAFEYFKEGINIGFKMDRTIYRKLVEACRVVGDVNLANHARDLMRVAHGDKGYVAEAWYTSCNGSTLRVRTGRGIHTTITKNLRNRLSFRHLITALPEQGERIPSHIASELLILHAEKQALAASQNEGIPNPFISVDLCMCSDCHSFFAAFSKVFGAVRCRDPNKLHVFNNGVCSCGDVWAARMSR